MDVATDLDQFIQRRAIKAPGPDELEASYAKAIRRYHARRRDANRLAWIHYYEDLARCQARLAQEHADRAEALLGERQTGGGEDLGA